MYAYVVLSMFIILKLICTCCMNSHLTECEKGFFGENCSSSCSGCMDTCDATTGSCSHCKPGWKGPFCSMGITHFLYARMPLFAG